MRAAVVVEVVEVVEVEVEGRVVEGVVVVEEVREGEERRVEGGEEVLMVRCERGTGSRPLEGVVEKRMYPRVVAIEEGKDEEEVEEELEVDAPTTHLIRIQKRVRT